MLVVLITVLINDNGVPVALFIEIFHCSRGGRGARQPIEGDRSGDENNELVNHTDRDVENAGGILLKILSVNV